MVVGNCGLSLAPAKPEDRDAVIKSFVRVEAISRRVLEAKPGLHRLFLLVFGVVNDIAMKARRKLFGAKRRSDETVVKNPTPLWQQLAPVLVREIHIRKKSKAFEM